MHVVLVDPNPTTTQIICQMLTAAGHQIRSFSDGGDAVEYFKSDATIDVIIASVKPLSMSGPQLCNEVRNIARGKRPVYIMLMSATSNKNALIHPLDFGADEFIRAPRNPQELYGLLRALRAAERSLDQQRELIRHANTDVLTGLNNRRSFFASAQSILARGTLVSAIMFDVDHFKQVNDKFGHDAGDKVLKTIAGAVQSTELLVGRLGGEEFAILLEGKDILAAFRFADALRAKIEGLCIATDQGPLKATCSFGVSERLQGETIDALLKRTDVAMYQAKTTGRNRVCLGTTDGGAEKPPGSVIRQQERDHPAQPPDKRLDQAVPLAPISPR